MDRYAYFRPLFALLDHGVLLGLAPVMGTGPWGSILLPPDLLETAVRSLDATLLSRASWQKGLILTPAATCIPYYLGAVLG